MNKEYQEAQQKIAVQIWIAMRNESDYGSLSFVNCRATWEYEGRPFLKDADQILNLKDDGWKIALVDEQMPTEYKGVDRIYEYKRVIWEAE